MIMKITLFTVLPECACALPALPSLCVYIWGSTSVKAVGKKDKAIKLTSALKCGTSSTECDFRYSIFDS